MQTSVFKKFNIHSHIMQIVQNIEKNIFFFNVLLYVSSILTIVVVIILPFFISIFHTQCTLYFMILYDNFTEKDFSNVKLLKRIYKIITDTTLSRRNQLKITLIFQGKLSYYILKRFEKKKKKILFKAVQTELNNIYNFFSKFHLQ